MSGELRYSRKHYIRMSTTYQEEYDRLQSFAVSHRLPLTERLGSGQDRLVYSTDAEAGELSATGTDDGPIVLAPMLARTTDISGHLVALRANPAVRKRTTPTPFKTEVWR